VGRADSVNSFPNEPWQNTSIPQIYANERGFFRTFEESAFIRVNPWKTEVGSVFLVVSAMNEQILPC
jgi:hypothetical protein